MAKKAGVSLVETRDDAPLSPAREKVAGELFAYGERVKTSGGSGIRIYKAGSTEEEITYLARRIKLLTKEGYRYNDIAVLAGNVEGVLPVVKKIFGDEGITFFANEQITLFKTPLSALVLGALRAGLEGLDRDRALSLIKNPYSGIGETDSSCFESYAVRYNVNYQRLTGEYNLGKGDIEYDSAKRVGEKLSSLVISLPRKASVREMAECVREFVQKNDIETKILEYSKAQSERGDILASSATRQSYAKLISTLDETEKFAGEAVVSSEEFLSVFSSAMASVKIAFTPLYADSVYVGGAVESRFSDCKVFFIIGANSGDLPSIKRNEGIFGDREAELLKREDIDLSPTSIEAGLEEKLHVLQLLLMPKEKLFISYVDSGIGSSELCDGLISLFDDIKVEDKASQKRDNYPEYIRLLASSELGASKALSSEKGDEQTSAYLTALVKGREKIDRSTKNIENASELFFPTGNTSITRIESYFRCPYRSFIENGIGARRAETAESKSYVGTFMHRIFELAIPELTKKGFPDGEELKNTVSSVIKRAFDEEQFGALSTEKYYTAKRRLQKEAERALYKMNDRCRKSGYTPTGFEVSFGSGDRVFMLKGENIALNLRGKIDRIDECGSKCVLVDYKTGKAPAEIKDIYFGTGVQLYVYMSAVSSTTGKEAVGALYYPLVGDFEKEGESGDRLKGFIKGSEAGVYNKEFDLTKTDDCFAYDVKDGKPTSASSVLCCSEEELEAIKDYSMRVSAQAVDEMSMGYIEPTPLDDACKYCDYEIICRKKIVRKRKSRTIKKEIVAGSSESAEGVSV